MAKSKASFERRERERAKKAKADAKRAKRADRSEGDDPEIDEEPGEAVDQGEVLEALAVLAAEFENGSIAFDDFEEERTRLLGQLTVD